jgi:uncharacterized protein (DUF488 family)
VAARVGDPALGGFRKPKSDSPNRALRNDSFRGYADYMGTPQFRGALDKVLEEAQRRVVAVMCSESVWWRCHRRLVADAAVLTRAFEVTHLMHGDRREPHRLTDGVRRTEDNQLRYDAGEEGMLPPQS